MKKKEVDMLIVAATLPETNLLREKLGLPETSAGLVSQATRDGIGYALLHTGIGMVNTAYHLGRCLLEFSPSFAIQVGIGGSFPGGPEIAEVVEVSSDCYAELGAGSPEGFLDLKTMGFENFRSPTLLYYNELRNPGAGVTRLRNCRGITVNGVHGRQEDIDRVVELWKPEVESMEGAAFFQCCLMAGVPFLQLRGISNRVEPRNRASWKIAEAARAAQLSCLEFMESTLV